MPLVQATILQGRTQEKKEAFCRAVAEAAVEHLDVQLPQVRVIISEVPPEHWTIGGVTKAELDARKSD